MAPATDPLSPPQPREVSFDAELDAWVFSRYSDVLAAFREPKLWPAGPRREPNLKIPDEAAQQRLRADTLAAISPANLAQWQLRFREAAAGIACTLPHDRPVEAVSEFIELYCAAAAEIVTGADPCMREQMLALAREVSGSSADPLDPHLRSRASAASAELNRCFPGAAVPSDGPTYVALARTMACLLANGWVALLRYPGEWALLRRQPDLIPKAIEELLRYAGLPQAMFRSVTENVELSGVKLAAGDRVVLALASANRDPAQFSNPDSLEVARRGPAHLAFGFGPHSCVGAALIRVAAAIATQGFVGHFAEPELTGPVLWAGGSGFQTAASFRVVDKAT